MMCMAGLAAAMLQPACVNAQNSGGPAQEVRPCPAGLDSIATCHAGRDANGAWLLTAIPKQWNHILVVHAHGGPRLGVPKSDDGEEDLERFAAMVRQGYAWTGSTYRRGGYGVRMAAADVDESRKLFWQQFGKPQLTILHGQSYGGNVAAKLAELGTTDATGNRLYDGVLLTNGVLWGGTKAYGFRADLRAVYQYFCRNHPRPDEPQYPLWQGLARESQMTRAELERRVNDCTGVNLPKDQRSAEQVRRVTAITGATGIAEDQLQRHLEWATFTFRDLVHERLGSRNPFDNSQTTYRGSGTDVELNRAVERFVADPKAVTQLAYDSDLTGLISAPTIALHWRGDPIVSPAGDRYYEDLVGQKHLSGLFVRLVSAKGSHSRLPEPDLIAALTSLVGWIKQGAAPDHAVILDQCKSYAASFNAGCTLE